MHYFWLYLAIFFLGFAFGSIAVLLNTRPHRKVNIDPQSSHIQKPEHVSLIPVLSNLQRPNQTKIKCVVVVGPTGADKNSVHDDILNLSGMPHIKAPYLAFLDSSPHDVPMENFIEALEKYVKNNVQHIITLGVLNSSQQLSNFIKNLMVAAQANDIHSVLSDSRLLFSANSHEVNVEKIRPLFPFLDVEIIYTSAPSYEERYDVLKSATGLHHEDEILSDAARISEGLSLEDLRKVVQAAKDKDASVGLVFSSASVMRSLCDFIIGPTVRYHARSYDKRRQQIAVHEAGHFVVSLHYALEASGGNISKAFEAINLVKISTDKPVLDSKLGFVLYAKTQSATETMSSMIKKVSMLYGGLANEEIFFGEENVSTGAYEDLKEATSILSKMFEHMSYKKPSKVCREHTSLLSTSDNMSKFSEDTYTSTCAILNKYKSLSSEIVLNLMEKYELDKSDMKKIVEHWLLMNRDQN